MSEEVKVFGFYIDITICFFVQLFSKYMIQTIMEKCLSMTY